MQLHCCNTDHHLHLATSPRWGWGHPQHPECVQTSAPVASRCSLRHPPCCSALCTPLSWDKGPACWLSSFLHCKLEWTEHSNYSAHSLLPTPASLTCTEADPELSLSFQAAWSPRCLILYPDHGRALWRAKGPILQGHGRNTQSKPAHRTDRSEMPAGSADSTTATPVSWSTHRGSYICSYQPFPQRRSNSSHSCYTQGTFEPGKKKETEATHCHLVSSPWLGHSISLEGETHTHTLSPMAPFFSSQ